MAWGAAEGSGSSVTDCILPAHSHTECGLPPWLGHIGALTLLHGSYGLWEPTRQHFQDFAATQSCVRVPFMAHLGLTVFGTTFLPFLLQRGWAEGRPVDPRALL